MTGRCSISQTSERFHPGGGKIGPAAPRAELNSNFFVIIIIAVVLTVAGGGGGGRRAAGRARRPAGGTCRAPDGRAGPRGTSFRNSDTSPPGRPGYPAPAGRARTTGRIVESACLRYHRGEPSRVSGRVLRRSGTRPLPRLGSPNQLCFQIIRTRAENPKPIPSARRPATATGYGRFGQRRGRRGRY